MSKPPRERPGEFQGSGLRLDWKPFSPSFVLDLIEATRLPLADDFTDLPNNEKRLELVVQRFNKMAVWWDFQYQFQTKPTDYSTGRQLSTAANHAEKLVKALPVVWEDDPLIQDDPDPAAPRGTARFATGSGACNPRLTDALQAAIEQHVRERDLDPHEPLLPQEWPADVLLQVRSLASVLRRAAEAHQAEDRKEKPSSHDAATTEFANEVALLYWEIFGKQPGVSTTPKQDASGPWIRFLGDVLRQMPGFENFSDVQLKALTERHIKQ